jgi:2-oxo-4-hydroxy-4-carboxy-5-ureidoimidazoline decarboxylase
MIFCKLFASYFILHQTSMPSLQANQLSQLSRQEFTTTFGGIFEHTPAIAEYVYDSLIDELKRATTLSDIQSIFEKALEHYLSQSEENGLRLIREHPKLGVSKLSSISAQSQNEQKSVGLTDVSEEEAQ